MIIFSIIVLLLGAVAIVVFFWMLTSDVVEKSLLKLEDKDIAKYEASIIILYIIALIVLLGRLQL